MPCVFVPFLSFWHFCFNITQSGGKKTDQHTTMGAQKAQSMALAWSTFDIPHCAMKGKGGGREFFCSEIQTREQPLSKSDWIPPAAPLATSKQEHARGCEHCWLVPPGLSTHTGTRVCRLTHVHTARNSTGTVSV